MAEEGTLKLDLRVLKSQNPFFFLEYLSTHYRAATTIKTLLPVIIIIIIIIIIIVIIIYLLVMGKYQYTLSPAQN